MALREIDENALFPNVQSASTYRDWYAGQAWAEEEPSDFNVIALGAVK